MKPESKDAFYLGHILEAIGKIEELMGKLSYEQFLQDWKTQDAVVRNLEVVGEAATNVSSSLKEEYPKIAWQGAKDMRNFLIHVYFSVDYQIVWNTVKNDLPPFKEQVIACLKTL